MEPKREDKEDLIQPPEDANQVKLYHANLELLTSVINYGLKKQALKSWATSCDLLHTNNSAMTKKRLCELLVQCTSEANDKSITLLSLLAKKLDDRTIKLELLSNQIPLSSTAVQRKLILCNTIQPRVRVL